jgi:ElaB/YqjD/DUF883 family membrane-anchored ribosome-binding protein
MATKTTEEHSEGAVTEVKERAADVVDAAGTQIAAKAGEVKEEASFQVREQVDHRSTQAGEQVSALAQAFRPSVEKLRSEGNTSVANVVDGLAGRADRLGAYLQSADADRILGDVEDFARRRPWLTAGAAALAGFMASRFVKASSERRYQTFDGDGLGSAPYGSRRSIAPESAR